MALSSATHVCKLLFLCFCSVVSLAALGTLAHQFAVGGSKGWIEPSGNETETYNDWAVDNRFQVGDSLYFKYSDDSVLVVESDAYEKCDTSNPISKYDDGNTIFVFDRYGFFYFISGAQGRCLGGQKLIVQVLGQSEAASSPEGSSPAPSSGGGAIASPPPSEDESPSAGGGGAGGGDDGKGGEGNKGGTPSSSTKLAFGFASALTALIGVFL
ncbi:hypothetical protein H6P81_002087 [Aristolochia fimbriata]|uniref:Phytocyanin domain-containing protein n=1 Tax=Aristolochia fimbriata TaxID=158543 RepID=A0AAV7FAF2_ARIFI|nr:hypothetical protein H6P81_002087 [Aristolochia fimbriata]